MIAITISACVCASRCTKKKNQQSLQYYRRKDRAAGSITRYAHIRAHARESLMHICMRGNDSRDSPETHRIMLLCCAARLLVSLYIYICIIRNKKSLGGLRDYCRFISSLYSNEREGRDFINSRMCKIFLHAVSYFKRSGLPPPRFYVFLHKPENVFYVIMTRERERARSLSPFDN